MANNFKSGNELINIDVIAKAGVEAGMRVGDLGCGNLAYFTLSAAQAVGKDGLVYAVDILKSVLNSVDGLVKQNGLENVRTIWSNLEIVGATKIEAESLDIAFLHNVLFQSDNDDLILKEAFRLLKKGGKLMVIDWQRVSAPFGPPVADRPKPEDVKKYATEAGFQFFEEFTAGPYHYGLMFEK